MQRFKTLKEMADYFFISWEKMMSSDKTKIELTKKEYNWYKSMLNIPKNQSKIYFRGIEVISK